MLAVFAAALAVASPVQQAEAAGSVTPVARVWSGHSVRFALVTTGTHIFVGYYDANRQLTIASRPRDADVWTHYKLDSHVGWDSHNYIAMAVDGAGQLHVAANMHNDPLVYFRTTRPGDVRTLARQAVMADPARERRMTYPVFLTDRAGGLVFKYRDGGSGNGVEIYNGYDAAKARWRPLLTGPLADGEGLRSAYFMGPERGPDGLFHITWVWRETPMAETNHDLSYARSPDLVRWQRADGTPLKLPITLATSEIVDPVPERGGMINNNTVIGFDAQGRAMIAYHKFDSRGDTQVYVARREGQRWHIAQASQWQGFRWDFRGGGSLDMRLALKGPEPAGKDRIRVGVVRDGKSIDLFVDAATLRPLGEQPARPAPMPRLAAVPAGMRRHVVRDPSGSGIAIAWATRPPNRDMPRTDISPPTLLELVIPGR